jgi:hypothetical protein
MRLKLFFVKGFVGRKGAARSFGFAAAATAGSNTAATIAEAKRAGNSVEQRTFAIDKVQKGDLTNGIVSRPTGHGWLQFPLWIKVPIICSLLAKSPRRCRSYRRPPKRTAIQHTYPD